MHKTLSDKQVFLGSKLCLENAKSLLNEAKLLYENEHYARAFSLIVFALEEADKIILLKRGILIDKSNDKAWSKLWEQFYSHRSKLHGSEIVHWPLETMEHALSGYAKKGDSYFEELYDEIMNRPHFFENMKLAGLYVDFKNDDFITPLKIDFNKHFDKYYKLAEKRINRCKDLGIFDIKCAKYYLNLVRLKRNKEDEIELLFIKDF